MEHLLCDATGAGTLYRLNTLTALWTGYDRFTKESFKDDNCYGSFKVEKVETNESRKITIITWLEGFDLDCNDEIKTANIKMEYIVSINNE